MKYIPAMYNAGNKKKKNYRRYQSQRLKTCPYAPPYHSMKLGYNVDFTMSMTDPYNNNEMQLQLRRMHAEERENGDDNMFCFHTRLVKVAGSIGTATSSADSDTSFSLSFEPMQTINLVSVDGGADLGEFTFHVYSFIPATPTSSSHRISHGILWCV